MLALALFLVWRAVCVAQEVVLEDCWCERGWKDQKGREGVEVFLVFVVILF